MSEKEWWSRSATQRKVLATTERILKQFFNRLSAIIRQMSGPGANESLMLNSGFILVPGTIAPSVPTLANLTIDMNGPIEKFCKLNSPSCSAFNRIVILDCAYHKNLMTVVDHVEDDLQDFAELLSLIIIALHHL